MSPNVNDFVTPIEKVNNMHVKGIGGMLKVKAKGSVAWNIKDENGVKNEIIIPDTLCVYGISHQLLSLQHWS